MEMGKRQIQRLFLKKQLNILGIMAGSSMDGVDVAYCQFSSINKQIHYQIIKTTTFLYSSTILELLRDVRTISAEKFFEYDVMYGKWIAKKIHQWIKKNNLKPDAIAMHGHTVFHYPEKGFSVQLGNASFIASVCKIPVVHNFRSNDIALGGQGAPLVPIGDKLLFHQYDACINIGGIANVFIQKTNCAYDICIANMALNYFAQKLNKPYDKDGKIAQSGKVNENLFQALNQLSFFRQKPPKSLNREYFENIYLPIIEKYSLSEKDIMATLVEHIGFQISKSIQSSHIKSVLITGGGAFNSYLIKKISGYTKNKIILVPDKQIVKYKEALIFALLGYLRINNQYGNIKEATGAKVNTICGEIVQI